MVFFQHLPLLSAILGLPKNLFVITCLMKEPFTPMIRIFLIFSFASKSIHRTLPRCLKFQNLKVFAVTLLILRFLATVLTFIPSMKSNFCSIILLYLVFVVQCDEEGVSHQNYSPRFLPETPPPTSSQSIVQAQSPSFSHPSTQSSHSSTLNINNSGPTLSNIVQPESTSSSSMTSSELNNTDDLQTHQPSQQHPSTSPQPGTSSESPSVSTHDPVFIPIKEWKRRKLHDIELRVKQFQQAQDSSEVQSSPDPEVSSAVRPFLIYSNPECNSLVLFLRVQTCSLFQEDAVHLRSITTSPVTSSLPSYIIQTEPPSTIHTEEQPSSRYSSVEHPHSSVPQVWTSAEPDVDKASAIPTEHQLLPSRYPVKRPKDELASWVDMRSSIFVSSLQRMAEFVKVVRDTSALLGLSLHLFSSPHQPILSTNEGLSRSSISLFSNGSVPHPDVSLWVQLNVSNSSDQSVVDRPHPRATDTPNRVSAKVQQTLSEQFQLSNTSSEKPYNFASVDSGARVLLSSKGTIGAKNVLDNNVDKYLLVPCGEGGEREPRWVDIELSEEVILERFQTGNFEYYSSSPAKIIILGSVTYPPSKWQLLGMFRFADVKNLQMFMIEKRVVARYLRVLFVGKQGHEYYCPISSITAYGKTLIADWKDALDQEMSKRRVETSRKPSSHPTTNQDQALKQNPKESAALDKPAVSHRDPNDDSGFADSRPSENLINNGNDASKDSHPEHIVESQTSAGASQSETSPKEGRVSPSDMEFSQVPEDARHRDQGTAENEDSMSEEDQLVLEAVHADSLDQSSADDNVFRKVTRMLRLLELNQTLTNQYIDAQLAKFASVIQILREKTDQVYTERGTKSSELQEQIDSLRRVVIDIQNENRLKNVLIVALLFVTCVLSAFLAALRVSSGATGALSTKRLVGGDHGIIMKDDSSDQEAEEASDGEQRRNNSRTRRKRKTRRKRRNAFESPMEGATETSHINGTSTPTETSANTLTTFVCTL